MSKRPGTRKRAAPVISANGRGTLAREKLIQAAIKILETKSIEAVTTREIAALSKQNISAITYYFGGKNGLYLAAVEHVCQVIKSGLAPLLQEITSFADGPRPGSAAAISLLKRLLRVTVAFHKDILGFTEIIGREQIHPTAAFTILFDGVLHELQLCGARLVAIAVGGGADDSEFKIRFHALLGEALIFRYARETIIRGVGWKDIDERESNIIATLIEEHVDLMLTQLRVKRKKETGSI